MASPLKLLLRIWLREFKIDARASLSLISCCLWVRTDNLLPLFDTFFWILAHQFETELRAQLEKAVEPHH